MKGITNNGWLFAIIFLLFFFSTLGLAQAESSSGGSRGSSTSTLRVVDETAIQPSSVEPTPLSPFSIISQFNQSVQQAFSQIRELAARLMRDWIKIENTGGEDSISTAQTKLRGNLFELASDGKEESVFVNIIVNQSQLGSLAEELSGQGIEVKGVYRTGSIISARVSHSKLIEVAQFPEVKSIWPDREFHASLDTSVNQVNAPVMWNAGYTGQGIKVAVLDTGIDGTHLMLQGKVLLSTSFTGEPPTDVAGHGTHVAGIIAGKQNGANTYNGVAPDAQLYNVKVLDNTGTGAESWIIAGINYALDPDNNPGTNDGAHILNLSLGGPYTDPNSPIVAAVESAISQGRIVVISSGNCGGGCPSSACQGFVGVQTPGIAPNAITVGAVDDFDQWACFSSGALVNNIIKPDVVAPGVNISSSYVGNSLQTISGTSASAPHVSGLAALLLQSDPTLSPIEVKELMELTSVDLGDPGKDVKYGSGMVDASQFLPGNVYNLLK